MAVELTREQQELLDKLEAEFSVRYTDNDPDYTKALEQILPPIVHPWYNHSRRNHDWSRSHRDHGGRDRYHRRDDRHHHRRDDRHHNRHHPYHRHH